MEMVILVLADDGQDALNIIEFKTIWGER